jgi:hypothetical protein
VSLATYSSVVERLHLLSIRKWRGSIADRCQQAQWLLVLNENAHFVNKYVNFSILPLHLNLCGYGLRGNFSKDTHLAELLVSQVTPFWAGEPPQLV